MNEKGNACLRLSTACLALLVASWARTQDSSRADDILRAASDDTVLTVTGFAYDAHDRPDPFEPWTARDEKGPRPPGIRGIAVDELDLMGIVMTPDGKERYAIVMGKDNKGYSLREGDELWNGKVKTIESGRVIFLRKVTDPLRFEPYEPVTKRLSPDGR